MQSGWDGQGVCGAPADGQDQLLYSEVEGNLSLKAGEEEGRDRGLRGGGSLCIYCCKSSQMPDDKFQLVTVKSVRMRRFCMDVNSPE